MSVVCTLMCECKHTVCVNVSLLLGTGGWDVWMRAHDVCCVWRAELQYCGCVVGAHCSSYRPSVGGSLPLEPDWARLMYKFNSLSLGGGGGGERRENKGYKCFWKVVERRMAEFDRMLLRRLAHLAA